MSPFEINFSAIMVVSPDAFALHSYMGGRRKGIKGFNCTPKDWANWQEKMRFFVCGAN